MTPFELHVLPKEQKVQLIANAIDVATLTLTKNRERLEYLVQIHSDDMSEFEAHITVEVVRKVLGLLANDVLESLD